MSIKNSGWPVYFHLPQQNVLSQELEQWETPERWLLEGTVCRMAVSEGVPVEWHDQEWGRHHLFDSDTRLIAAMMRQRTLYVQARAGCSERVADLLMKQCPLVDGPALSSAVLQDLIQRAKLLDRLEKLRDGLHRKYPDMNNDEARCRAWKSQEIFFLTLPAFLSQKEEEGFEYFMSVGEELMRGSYDPATAAMILDRLQLKETRHGLLSDLQDHLRLLVLNRTAKEHIVNGTLPPRAAESVYKDIFVVSSSAGRGKFKPLPLAIAAKEAYAYRLDRVLGIGMTAPTGTLKPQFSRSLALIQDLFRSAAVLMGEEDAAAAQRLQERAFATLQADDFPSAARNTIFGEMYALCGGGRQVNDLGRKLMLHLDGYQSSDSLKELAVGNAMRSPWFQETLKNDSRMAGSMAVIQDLFRAAAVLMESREIKSRENVLAAQRLKKRAFATLQAEDFPRAVRNTIFGEMYALCGEMRQVDDLGRKLMLDLDGYQTADCQKALAVENTMRSSWFQDFLKCESEEGSVQIWQSQCQGSGLDQIIREPEGGRRLAATPKTLVHFYALLGMLKGSMDCTSNNTLLEWNAQRSAVSNFWDIDDERSMPESGSFWKIRLWQLGLPQCARAFDRAFLLLFSDPEIARKLKSVQSFPQISASEYGRQLERLHAISTLFAEELKKGEITLTPRDLYFRCFPGSKEEFDRVTTSGGGESHVSPIELFDFYLCEWGTFHLSTLEKPTPRARYVNAWGSAEAIAQQKRLIDVNLEALRS